MIFSIDYILDRAREILQDDAKERYPDARLLAALNLAIVDMMRIRPDINALSGTIPGFPYSDTSLNQGIQFPVDIKYSTPVVEFVAGWAELADDEFATDNRASSLLTRFQSQLMVGG